MTVQLLAVSGVSHCDTVRMTKGRRESRGLLTIDPSSSTYELSL